MIEKYNLTRQRQKIVAYKEVTDVVEKLNKYKKAVNLQDAAS